MNEFIVLRGAFEKAIFDKMGATKIVIEVPKSEAVNVAKLTAYTEIELEITFKPVGGIKNSAL